jgi:hypothetical protein
MNKIKLIMWFSFERLCILKIGNLIFYSTIRAIIALRQEIRSREEARRGILHDACYTVSCGMSFVGVVKLFHVTL